MLYLQIFNAKNYILFKILDSGLFLKYIFLKFRKFQPRYSYKIAYSFKGVLTVDSNVRLFSLHMRAYVSESYDPRLCLIVL